jgi:hypothetical protein
MEMKIKNIDRQMSSVYRNLWIRLISTTCMLCGLAIYFAQNVTSIQILPGAAYFMYHSVS